MVGPFRRFCPLVAWGWSRRSCPRRGPGRRGDPAGPSAPGRPARPRGLCPARRRSPQGVRPGPAPVGRRPEARRVAPVLRRGPGPGGPPAVRRRDPVARKGPGGRPRAIPVLRRLSRINFALGRESRGDRLLPAGHRGRPGRHRDRRAPDRPLQGRPARRRDVPQDALGNPKLNKASTGALYLEYELGNLYEATLRFDQAADAFAKVVDALDEKSNAKLTPSDLRRFLGTDEGQAYLRFGRVFLQAKKSTWPSGPSAAA